MRRVVSEASWKSFHGVCVTIVHRLQTGNEWSSWPTEQRPKVVELISIVQAGVFGDGCLELRPRAQPQPELAVEGLQPQRRELHGASNLMALVSGRIHRRSWACRSRQVWPTQNWSLLGLQLVQHASGGVLVSHNWFKLRRDSSSGIPSWGGHSDYSNYHCSTKAALWVNPTLPHPQYPASS